MILPQMENVAQIFAARILNSLPEGILIAAFVWLLLRLLPRQNSRTRFAVWFLALIAVALLPFAGGSGGWHSAVAMGRGGEPFLMLSSDWAFALFIGWTLVTCFALLRLAIGVWQVQRLRKSCATINPAELEPAIAKVVGDFAMSHSVTMATSEQVTVPASLGFLKPTIVLPHWALRELAPQELNTILIHEFAHVERRDGWTNLLQKLVRAIFCFHPAVWWIESRLSLEREMACDDYVLAHTHDPRSYAKCLLAVLERNFARRGWAMAQAAVHRAHEATLRLTQILDANRAKTKHVWKPALGLVGVFSLACLTVLPQTRQLVGFAPEDHATYESAEALAPSAPLLPPAVVPAALHLTASPAEQPQLHKTVNKRHPKTMPQLIESRPVLAARAESELPRIVNARADQEVVPITQAVFVIRTMNQIDGNWEWSIHVWQVTVFADHAPRVPIIPSRT